MSDMCTLPFSVVNGLLRISVRSFEVEQVRKAWGERVEGSGMMERGSWVGTKCGVVLVFSLSEGNLERFIKTDSTVVKSIVDCYFVINLKSFRCA